MNMREIQIDELKTIQLDILASIDEFCRNHSINYSMACGTLLGAIRHKGYIPWDDDIDIYLLREDYKRLIREFPSEYKHIKIASLERDSKWDRAYAQAYDDRTLLQSEARGYAVGVGIDVYPIDTVPQKESDWLKFNKKRRFFQHLYVLKYLKVHLHRSLLKNLLILVSHIILLPFTQRNIGRFLDKYAQKYNGIDSEYVFECCQGMIQKRPFMRSCMCEFIDVPFEDRKFMSMKNYDSYLSNGYGDYMKLPPVEKRVANHSFKAYMK